MRQTQNAQKKDNRKSIFVIGLLLLLVAVIGFGGYTLSKYVTKKDASGSASVAKWGFTVTSDATNLFGANYEFKTGATNSTVTKTNDATKLTVKASNENSQVVAPGTTGSMTFIIDGTAEVKAKVEIALTDNKDIVLEYKKGETAGTYNPVKWTLKKDGANIVANTTLEKIAVPLIPMPGLIPLNGYGRLTIRRLIPTRINSTLFSAGKQAVRLFPTIMVSPLKQERIRP